MHTNRITRHLNYANVMATLGVFIALGGASYAAVVLPTNSVGTKQLRKSAVTAAKIKANAVTGPKVAADRLTGREILETSLGKVPSASSADTAGHAGIADNATNATNAGHATNADTVGGRSVTTFSKLVARNTSAQTALDFGGFKLQLACDAGGASPTLTGIGSVEGSLIRGMKNTENGADGGFGSSDTHAGVAQQLFGGTDDLGGISVQYVQPDGHVVSVNAYVDDSHTIDNFDGCSVSGSAISG